MINKLLYWIPRILAILFMLFMHNIPALIVAAVLVVA